MSQKYLHRKRRGWLSLIIFIVAGILFFAQKSGLVQESSRVVTRNQPGLYSVAYFVDGDTLAVNMNGKVEKVRFIGMDTPETHKPNTPVQCYGPAAAAFTKNTIGSQHIRLVSDSLSTDRDRYNRLLRYVYLPDGTDVNELLVRGGYAFYYPYFPFTKSEQFAADQQAAMTAHKGLWGNCHPTRTDAGGYVSNPQA